MEYRADPELHNGKVLGTILEVRVGKNAPNANGTVESWWNDAQAGNALRTTYTSIADRFIEMNPGTGVTNLSIWYPEQDINHIQPYPWTLFQTRGDCATMENIRTNIKVHPRPVSDRVLKADLPRDTGYNNDQL